MTDKTFNDLSEDEKIFLMTASKELFFKMADCIASSMEELIEKKFPLKIVINAISIAIESIAYKHFNYLRIEQKISLEDSLKLFCKNIKLYSEELEKKNEFVKSLIDY